MVIRLDEGRVVRSAGSGRPLRPMFDPCTSPGGAFRKALSVTRTGLTAADARFPYPKRGTYPPKMDASGVTHRDDLGHSTQGVLKP
jgi:hypothetical protein